MIPVPRLTLLIALAVAAAPVDAQQRLPTPPESALPSPPYAEYADLVLAAPLVIDAGIRSVSRLKGPDAAGVMPGQARLYIEADVLALIRGETSLPPRIAYVLDVPIDARGRLPQLRRARVLLFARPVAGNPGLVQLVRPDAQRDWTPGSESLTRRITQETLAQDAPPEVTGVGNAFHVAGDLPGAGETQIFLTTRTGVPVSITIERRPDTPRRWWVALTEIVDDAAQPPARDTLLWYRLACALPAALPEASLTSTDLGDAAMAREDYSFVMQSLGPCDRGGAL